MLTWRKVKATPRKYIRANRGHASQQLNDQMIKAGDSGVNITIDPGVVGTGYAIWEPFCTVWGRAVAPKQAGAIYPDRSIRNWEHKIWDIERKMLSNVVIPNRPILNVIIELPQIFESNTGRICSSSGDIIKLAIISGVIGELFRVEGSRILYVPVNTWKGQLSKNVITCRAKRSLAGKWDNKWQSHAIDAIALGLWMKGVLK